MPDSLSYNCVPGDSLATEGTDDTFWFVIVLDDKDGIPLDRSLEQIRYFEKQAGEFSSLSAKEYLIGHFI